MSFRDWLGREFPEPGRPLAQAITEDVGRPVPQGQAIVENFGGLPRSPWTSEWMGQHARDLEEAANRYAEGLAAERREARARAMHHREDPPRWSFERQEHPSLDLSFDPATGEITNFGGSLPDEDTLFNPGSLVVDTPENSQLAVANIEPSWELSIGDAITDKYKEMEKRVAEQDKTIAEMKSIIENLQDIVYQRKLDKEAESLVL